MLMFWRFGILIAIFTAFSCAESNFAGSNLGAKKNGADAKGAEKKSKPGDGGHGDDTVGGDGKKGGSYDPKNDSELNVDVSDDGTVRESFKGLLTEKSVDLDIVFAMDTSGSMASEKSRLESSMATFMTAFREKAKAVNFKVYMIGKSFSFPTPDANLTLVDTKVSSNNALAIIKGWVTGAGSSLLRPAAAKHVIVVTDDNARGETASTFSSFISSNALLKDHTSVHGMIGLVNGSVNSWCSIAAIGSEYQTLAATTTGRIFDLCQENWDDLLNKLAEAIIVKEAQSEFQLSHAVADPLTLSVRINGTALASEKWQYDPSANKISIQAGSAPTDGDTLEVQYKKK